jgi:hypothetical protein
MTEEPMDTPPEPDPGRPAFMGPAAPVAERSRSKPSLPRWVPWSIAGALIAGIAVGAAGTLLLTGEAPAPGESGGQAAAQVGGDSQISEITIAQSGITDPDAYGEVEVNGSALARFTGQGDPMVGLPSPELQGHDFRGNPVAITADGRAKIVVFLAHWCPYCQQELQVVRDWYASGAIPDGVDVYSVSTLTDFTKSNYPPRPWFERENWNIPLIVDDYLDTAATAFGLNAVPFWVMIDADATIAGRWAGGGIPAEALTSVAEQLVADAGSSGGG